MFEGAEHGGSGFGGEPVKGLVGEAVLVEAYHVGKSKVAGEDESGGADGAIAQGGVLVEVSKACLGFLELVAGEDQLFVLHLELNLVYPEFVEQCNRLIVGELLGVFGQVIEAVQGQRTVLCCA